MRGGRVTRRGKEAESRSRGPGGQQWDLVKLGAQKDSGLGEVWRVDCWEDVEPTCDPEVCGVLERPGAHRRKPRGRLGGVLMRLRPTGWVLVGEGDRG